MNNDFSIFDFAAQVGITKHIGSVQSTEELLKLCQIKADQYILDVGCGAGATPCYIAKNYHCRVAGIDILAGMIECSKELADREKVTESVEFRVGDAQKIPYDDNLFDIVITESVTSFVEDPGLAINEYVRVLKPGGYIGLNESTWFKPPTAEMLAWVSQEWGGGGRPHTSDEWTWYLQAASLEEIASRTYHINMKAESKGIIKRYGWGGMLRIMGRMLSMYFKNPAYRNFVKEVKSAGIVPKNIEDYFGYGLYVGRKL
jgi:ubiquinone/menaquinone biosynthesis C-methylase UbiE